MFNNFTLKPETPSILLNHLTNLKQKYGEDFFCQFSKYGLKILQEEGPTFQYKQYMQVLKYGSAWRYSEFYNPLRNFGHKQSYKILITIGHIDFSELIYMYLEASGIKNIEPLIYMNFKSLRHLNLEDNQIINFKPLSHTYLPNLDSLIISDNPHRENCLSLLNRMKYNARLFHQLKIGCIREDEQSQIQDGTNLLKLQTNNIKRNLMTSTQWLWCINYRIQQVFLRKFNKAKQLRHLIYIDLDMMDQQNQYREYIEQDDGLVDENVNQEFEQPFQEEEQ